MLLMFWRIWRHNDNTWKLLVLLLIDMGRGDQVLYIGTENNIIAPYYRRFVGVVTAILPKKSKVKQTNKIWLDKG